MSEFVAHLISIRVLVRLSTHIRERLEALSPHISGLARIKLFRYVM